MFIFLSTTFLLLSTLVAVSQQNVFLSPPYFNLAEGKNITATATCGEDNGRPINETYCKTTGANPFTDQEGGPQDVLLWQAGSFIRGGQLCDYCKSDVLEKSHPIQNSIDGTGRWWQSPPLSRGEEYNRVNITIDLGQEYHVAYVYIRMATSPRPAIWVLERSVDDGKTFMPWQYFAESDRQCREMFNTPAEIMPYYDEQVLCVTRFSNLIPLEEGEIVVSLVNDRPSSHGFAFSERLQEFTKATNIRLRLLRAKTLYGQLMSQSHDPTILRRYYYSVKDISIGGRCVCNGHASICNETVPGIPTKLRCRCQHNTCGYQCETCCPGFRNRPWRPASTTSENSCEACECNGHSKDCEYNETLGYAVCSNCTHHTAGLRCDKCISGYYHPKGVKLNDPNSCVQCNCPLYDEETGTQLSSESCGDENGICQCLPAFTGENCGECSPDHMGEWPNCQPCFCYIKGSVGAQCGATGGRCTCRDRYTGEKCNKCKDGFFNSTSREPPSVEKEECIVCDCNADGTEPDTYCDRQSGQCQCKPGFGGIRCDKCAAGSYGYPDCRRCNCETSGVNATICSQSSGECFCKERFTGPRCEACQSGFYNRGVCDPCQCSGAGVSPQYPNICMENGACYCKAGFSGLACDSCGPGFFAYPECQACNCSAEGTISGSADDCDVKTGQCRCRSTTAGRLCSECQPNLYNFPECEPCNCDPAGAIQVAGLPPGGCGHIERNMLCKCKSNVEGRICSRCRSGYWNLNAANPDGCESCSCDITGTLGELSVCQNATGQCHCRRWATSRDCSSCSDGFYRLDGRNPFACTPCDCDRGGSRLSTPCNKMNGQCECLVGIHGLKCNEPDSTHYFPTLHQHQFEMEDGYQLEGNQKNDARYLDDESLFSSYSWKGYAVMSAVQSEVFIDLPIEVTSRSNTTHYVIFSYVNPNDQDITGTIRFRPSPTTESAESTVGTEQTLPITFKSSGASTRQMFTDTKGPFELASSYGSPVDMTLVLDLKNDLRRLPSASLFVDYAVLLPSEYREGVVLRQRINEPCSFDTRLQSPLCRWYTYPAAPIGAVESTAPNECAKTTITAGLPKPQFIQPFANVTLPQDLPQATLGTPLTYLIRPPAATGRYVVLIDFAAISNVDQSPAELDVSVGSGRSGKAFGFVRLHHCRFFCRQVVKAESGNLPGVFNLAPLPASDGCVPITLDLRQGGPLAVAIKSITLVPLNAWKISLLRPEPACLVVNGKCSPETYPDPPAGTVVSNFASAPTATAFVETLETIPNHPKVVSVGQSSVTSGTSGSSLAFFLSANITTEGKYNLYVHYFQPLTSELRLNGITINSDRGSSYRQIGSLSLPFCPNNAGCFAEIMFPNTQESNSIPLPVGVVSVDFATSPNVGPSHLNRLLVIPARKSETGKPMFEVQQLDLSSRFYSQCTSKGYYIEDSKGSDSLCRQLLFTLTTAYNHGSLSCSCDSRGLDSDIVSRMGRECASLGGQCYCLPNVIGRQCSACRPGFYGFPDCKRCDCDRGTCDADTGECICPPLVGGDKCDRCVPGAWGFNRIQGCQSCNCDKRGVRDGRIDACNAQTGNCTCRDNIESRRCDRCRAGFYSFPDCAECDCDKRGTLEGICNGDSGQCRCKPNIDPTSPRCDNCKPNHYHLDVLNPQGCTKCYCCNQARICKSEQRLIWQPVMEMTGWRTTPPSSVEYTPQDDQEIRTYFSPPSVAHVDFLLRPESFDPTTYYFVAPGGYLNNQVKAYGGNLKWTVHIMPEPSSTSANGASVPDVILIGGRFQPPLAIGYTFPDNPFTSAYDQPVTLSVPMTERSFRRIGGPGVVAGTLASRDDFMEVLISLKAILIRASYSSQPYSVTLKQVTLDSAVFSDQEAGQSQRASSVEVCSCPAGYSGTSCEVCADGYTRKQLVSGGFECVPCDCNGRSEKCDRETGECLECHGNFAGARCERCMIGHYYDSSSDTCKLCRCPGTSIETTYANNCTYDNTRDRFLCDCRPEYSGTHCQVCAAGHFGDPTAGKPCTPCLCNNNIDPKDTKACDHATGVCTTCLHNTGGTSCEQCLDWFYGSALEQRCVACDCDKCGSLSCDKVTGLCQCRQNVTSQRCNSCLPNYYGFKTCEGCKPCDCGAASVSATCDPVTGQCPCVSSSVTGRRCEECADGFWQYTAEGCMPCECGRNGSFTCDKATGRCLCKEGYTGPRCESCAPGWLPIEGIGCHACDECVRQLASEVYEEERKAQDAYSSLQQLSASVEARNRLSDLKGRLANVTNMLTTSSPQEIAQHANEQMGELTRSLQTIKQYLADFQKRMVEIRTNGDKYNVTSKAVSSKFDNLTRTVTGLEDDLNNLVALVKRYIESLRDPVQFNWREMLDAAQSKILDMERALNSSKLESEAWRRELDSTMRLFESVTSLHQNFSVTQARLDEIQLKLNTTLPKRLSELDDGVSQILKTAEDLRRNLSSGESELRIAKEKIGRIGEQEQIALKHLADLIRDTGALNTSLDQCEATHGPTMFQAMANQCSKLEGEMAQFVSNWMGEISKYNETIVPRQTRRVQELEDRVRAIEQQIFNPSENQRQAIDVATRFDKIAEKLTTAYATIDRTVGLLQHLADNTSSIDRVSEFRDRASQIAIKIERLDRERESIDFDAKSIVSKLGQEDKRLGETEAKIEQTGTILGMVKEKDLVIGLDDLGKRSDAAKEAFDSIAAEAKTKDIELARLQAHLQGKDPEAERNLRQAAIDSERARLSQGQIEDNWKNLKRVEQELRSLNSELGELTDSLWALIGRSKEATAQLSDIRPAILLNSSSSSAEIALDHETVAALGVDISVDLQHLPCEIPSTGSGKSLVFYLGPNFAGLTGNATNEADFLAVELSRPDFGRFKYWTTLNLGQNSRLEGSVEFSHKLPVGCNSPGLMHRLSIRRSAQQLNLTVGYRHSGRHKEETAPGTFTTYLPDSNFFFRPKMPRMFVGGLPRDFVAPSGISRSASTGLYQHLDLHSTKPTALFNLANFTNLKLANGMSRTDDYNMALLSGDLSYVSLPLAANKINRTEFQVISFAVEFATIQPNALLAYMASDDKKDFVALDLRDGVLRLQFDMYKHVLEIKEDCGGKKFNDGVLHRVLVEVSNKMSSLYAVDCPEIQRAEYPQPTDSSPNILNVDTLYLGGVHETIAEKLIRRVYHNENRQVEPKLIGCIGKVSLLAPKEARDDFYETLDAEEVIAFRPYNHRSYGAKFGYETCPSVESESWLVSFSGRPTSFYQFQTANVERVAFMLKTMKPGLVFFMRNEKGWSLECSVIEDQQLRKIIVVYRNNADNYVKLSAPITKLMGDWISVLIALNTNDRSLLLNVEDRDIWKETGEKVQNLLPNDGNVLLEGLADVFLGGAGVHSESLDFGQSLDGCIGRLLINNKAELFRQIPGTHYRLGQCTVQSARQKHTPCQLDAKAALPDISQLPDNSYCYTFGKQTASVRFLGKPKFSDRMAVSVKLRTVHRSGLIFYAHGNSTRKDASGKPIVPDYMMAYLHDGRVVFRFDAGSGVLELASNSTMAKYNDGRQHKLTFFRDGNRYGFAGDLDQPMTQEFPTSYTNRKIDGIDWLFLGGFSQEFLNLIEKTTIEQRGYERMEIDGRQTLIGTLSDFTLDGKLFEQPQPVDTNPCYDSLEHGVFFAELIDRPSTASLSRTVEIDPYQFTLTLMVRPRTTRALIAYVHDLSEPSNSLSIFLSAGRLYAMPGSGSPRQAVNVPISSPCVGDWIRIVVGSRPDSIKIAADHQRQTLRLYRKRRERDAGTKRHMRLYVGGLPDRLRESRFTPVTDSFVGCIDAVYLGPPSSASLLPLSSFDRNGESGTISLVDYCPLY